MSSAVSRDQGQKQMRGTDSAIADKQIFAAAASPTSEGSEERCLITCGVAQGHGHFQERLEAGIGMPV
jgi:hypothetical protein